MDAMSPIYRRVYGVEISGSEEPLVFTVSLFFSLILCKCTLPYLLGRSSILQGTKRIDSKCQLLRQKEKEAGEGEDEKGKNRKKLLDRRLRPQRGGVR